MVEMMCSFPVVIFCCFDVSCQASGWDKDCMFSCLVYRFQGSLGNGTFLAQKSSLIE